MQLHKSQNLYNAMERSKESLIAGAINLWKKGNYSVFSYETLLMQLDLKVETLPETQIVWRRPLRDSTGTLSNQLHPPSGLWHLHHRVTRQLNAAAGDTERGETQPSVEGKRGTGRGIEKAAIFKLIPSWDEMLRKAAGWKERTGEHVHQTIRGCKYVQVLGTRGCTKWVCVYVCVTVWLWHWSLWGLQGSPL